MPQNSPRLHAGHRSPHEMQVGPADGRRGKPENGVRRLLYDGLRDIIQADVPDIMPDDSFHQLAPKGGGVCRERRGDQAPDGANQCVMAAAVLRTARTATRSRRSRWESDRSDLMGDPAELAL